MQFFKLKSPGLSILFSFLFLPFFVRAQVPNISYSTPQVYTYGTAISTLSPSNSGGAVAGVSYSTPSTTFASITGTPYTVATDAVGNVYSADQSNGNLYKYTSSGTRTTLNTTTLNTPSSISIDASGNIWVSDIGTNDVYKFNSSGTWLATITGFNQPYGIAFDSSGNAYVVSYGNGRIYEIAAGTTTKTTYLTGFTNPYGIAIDPSGNMFVSQYTSNNVIKIAAGTATKTTFATGFNGPRNITTDASGDIYVADSGNNAIKKITPTGTVSSFYTNGLSAPRDVSLDGSGDLYVANSGGNNLKKAVPLGGYFISASLPAGLSFNSTTGAITGTPTAVQTATTYTITAYNASGSNATTVTITCNPAVPTISPASTCGSGAVTLTAGGGSPSGGTYDWYTAATGGTLLQSSTSTTYSPTISVTTTYYVCYTVSGASSTRAAVTATVNAAASSSFSATSAVYTGSNATVTYTGTDPASSTYSWNFNGGTPSTGTGQGPFSVQWPTAGTKTITLTVTNAAGCSSSSTQNVIVTAAYGNYAFSRQVTLNTTSLGITSNLSSFPALLSIQDDDLMMSGTCTDKIYNSSGPNYDFAFVDPSTAGELYYQVESYNQTTGTLLVWVQIPTLTYATNNTITFYYGSKTPTVTHNTAFFEKTWASDYLAVYHFNESSFTGSVADGTAGGHTGTTSGMTSSDFVTGKIGNAYTFANGKQIASATNADITGNFTLSAWVYMTTGGLDQKILTNQGSAGGYKLGVYTNNIPEVETRNASGNPVTSRSAGTGTSISTGSWYYLQGVYNGSKLSVYINGSLNYSYNTTQNPTTGSVIRMGTEAAGATGFNFNGMIDEPRISNVAKTADWIKAEYGDQNSPTTFTTVGTSTLTNTTNAATISGALTYTWTGASSTDPANANNWNNTTAGTTNDLPALDGSASLVIPSGLSNYPSLTADENLYGLTIASGASLNLNGHILSVGCNIYNGSGGQILYGTNNSSGLIWNGSAASQTYTGTNTASTAQLGSMTINNSSGGTVTISGGPVDIYKTLTLTDGNLVVGSSPAALTLKSTATTTASVAAIPTGSSITGTVNVERYITGGSLTYRGYRLLSSPVYASTVSSNNVYSINYLKKSIYLTATTTSGGFDNPGGANPTLYLFRENMTPAYSTFLNSNYRGINNMTASPTYGMDDASYPTANIPVGNGYLCWFRGNRASAVYATETTTSYIPQAATLSTGGTLNQGQIIVKDWFTPSSSTLSYTAASPASIQGYNLVGNPYASSIDWETFQSSSSTTGIYGNAIGPAIWVLDPVSHNYGAYVKGSGGVGTNNASNVISSGQGFFVVAGSTSASLIFNESAKTASQPSGTALLMGTPADQTANSQYLRLQLAMDSVNTDDMLVRFNSSATPNFDPAVDAAYKTGFGTVSLSSLSSDKIPLAINTLPLPKTTQSIGLTITANADGVYYLTMKQLTGIPELYDIWLMDRYKKDSLDMRHNHIYAFKIAKSDTNSYGSNRFALVIRQNPAYAYHLLSFTAAKIDIPNIKRVQINWTAENEQNYTHFTVERSVDAGKTFQEIGGVAASAQGAYGLQDNDPANQNLYRLKSEDINGAVTYSFIVPVGYSALSGSLAENNINVYPNPATSNINLSITNVTTKKDAYNIAVTDGSGIVVKQAITEETQWQTSIANLIPGTYFIKVIDNNTQAIIGNSKFIKL